MNGDGSPVNSNSTTSNWWGESPPAPPPPPPEPPLKYTKFEGTYVEFTHVDNTLRYAYSIRRHVRINLQLIRDYGIEALSKGIEQPDPDRCFSQGDEEESEIAIIQQRFAHHHVGITENLRRRTDVGINFPNSPLDVMTEHHKVQRNYFCHIFTTADAAPDMAWVMQGIQGDYERILRVVDHTIGLLKPLVEDESVWDLEPEEQFVKAVNWLTGEKIVPVTVSDTRTDDTVIEEDDNPVKSSEILVEDITTVLDDTENLEEDNWCQCPNCGHSFNPYLNYDDDEEEEEEEDFHTEADLLQDEGVVFEGDWDSLKEDLH